MPSSRERDDDVDRSVAVDSSLRELLAISEPSGSVAAAAQLGAGDELLGRYVIERFAGSGGMSTVYRGYDRVAEEPVAIKVLRGQEAWHSERFMREARVLAALSHPSIIRYLAHGSDGGRMVLITEWLEGQDLRQTLKKRSLTIEDSLRVVTRVAEALAFAHQHGVVHRDIKPSNLFLVEGEIDRLKLLDFGIARWEVGAVRLTQTSAVLGTVGYMAPEQARGDALDARADVFALGCVLYECLTGRQAFSGKNALAVLAKVLQEPVPRLGGLEGERGVLDGLLARLLAKEPDARPKDGGAVLALLDRLMVGEFGFEKRHAAAGLTASEQKLVTVVLAAAGDDRTGPLEADAEQRLQRLVSRLGIEIVPLPCAGLMLALSDAGAATDQACQAAITALALQDARPELSISIATGRADTTGRVPIGAVIDRAAELLNRAPSGEPGLAIDELTAGLLGPRFELQAGEQCSLLIADLGAQNADWRDARRLLLGRQTPCVGRDRELSFLEATLAQSCEENVARAVVVRGSAGIGKSRLMREWLSRVSARNQVRVLFTRSDPMSSNAAFSVAQGLVRNAAHLRAGVPVTAQHAQLSSYLQTLPALQERDAVLERLSDLIGAPDPAAPFARAAGRGADPAGMVDQTRWALRFWLDAECAAAPLLIVVEDLHWGDAQSFSWLRDTLRRQRERALMIFGLARSDEGEHSPWPLTDVPGLQEMRLEGVSPRAAERLVSAALGPGLEPAIARRIVDLAAGNAFYLEELIRRVAEELEHGLGAQGAEHAHVSLSILPETVLAMAQSRLERLAEPQRRILRAASVLGEVCWAGAVEVLVGDGVDVTSQLEALVSAEILDAASSSRFAGEREYRFGHALLRDAAYAMVAERERAAAHRLAAEWLEAAGENEPWLIADHYRKGKAPSSELPWVLMAARVALQLGDVEGATRFGRRGVELGASGEVRGALLLAQAYALVLGGRYETLVLEEALSLLPDGSPSWWFAVSLRIWSACGEGRPGEAEPWVARVVQRGPHLTVQGLGLTTLIVGLIILGHAPAGSRVLECFELEAAQGRVTNPVFRAWLLADRAHLWFSMPDEGNLEPALVLARDAAQQMEALGAAIGHATALQIRSLVARDLGLYEEAEDSCRRAFTVAKRVGYEFVARWAEFQLAVLLIRKGCGADAIAILEVLHEAADQHLAFMARAASAEAYRRAGDLKRSRRDAQLAANSPLPVSRCLGRVVLALLQLGVGEREQALATIQSAQVEGVAASVRMALELRFANVQVLDTLGRRDQAKAALFELQAYIARIAQRIRDPELRESFLTKPEVNVLTAQLAARWQQRQDS